MGAAADPAFAPTAPPVGDGGFGGPPPGAAPYAPPPAPVAAPAAAPAADGARVLAGFIVSFEGNELGTFWPLYAGKNVIGRKDAMEGLDIEIDHPTTSSRHAVISATARPGRLTLEDPGSTNGTYLSGERLPNNQPRDLKDGDAVEIVKFLGGG